MKSALRPVACFGFYFPPPEPFDGSAQRYGPLYCPLRIFPAKWSKWKTQKFFFSRLSPFSQRHMLAVTITENNLNYSSIYLVLQNCDWWLWVAVLCPFHLSMLRGSHFRSRNHSHGQRGEAIPQAVLTAGHFYSFVGRICAQNLVVPESTGKCRIEIHIMKLSFVLLLSCQESYTL